jgi:hypothetical protein
MEHGFCAGWTQLKSLQIVFQINPRFERYNYFSKGLISIFVVTDGFQKLANLFKQTPSLEFTGSSSSRIICINIQSILCIKEISNLVISREGSIINQ